MRGTLVVAELLGHESGIIPAYAGNTIHQYVSERDGRDHPRVCGEHIFHRASMYCPMGSSPRMRGTHKVGQKVTTATGIIPAYAGNTVSLSKNEDTPWDHPRVCGEHVSVRTAPSTNTGSSPRMRGTPELQRHHRRNFGIIPAYAGNTRVPACQHHSVEDHPRVCGEHNDTIRHVGLIQGSSPRMRGTLPDFNAPDGITGIIPAYAGNTSSKPKTPTSTRDHPRVCGEHQRRAVLVLLRLGSSPRMRGTLAVVAPQVLAAGIIPAYAGNTR